jgi:signal transduction histidine kinase/ActR/RegA family two-component response regulator
MRTKSLSRSFFLLLAAAFSLAVMFTVRLTFVFSAISKEGAALGRNFRATSRLNEQLRAGIAREVNSVRTQLDKIDPAFAEKFAELDQVVAQTQIEYLKLDIGTQERSDVEKMRSLQSELGVESFQVYQRLRSGDLAGAKTKLASIENIQAQIDALFERLHNLQMDKLQSVQNQLDRVVDTAFVTIYALAGGLLLTLAIVMTLLRRRVLSPVNSIYRATVRLTNGDFSARAPVSRLDEIGTVAQGFNFMAESLVQSYEDLERKVEERTGEVKKLQQEIVQTAKMSAVGQMISGVAHELNNPLTVIMGFSELGKMRLEASGGDPEQIRQFEEMYSQSERCRKIVANLLQFARKTTPRFEPIDINELVEKVLQLREYEFQTRNVKFLREYDRTNPRLTGDKNAIQQVLLNLINNAYDSIREAGTDGTIRVRTFSDGAYVVFEVIDNGTGIREPDHLFEPFYTTKEVGLGTGLGLSVCYGIVKEHHGEITAGNWSGGARFTVRLPACTGETVSEVAEQPRLQPALPRRYTALVVDDETSIVDLQRSFLQTIGVEPVGVHSGADAIGFLRKQTVNIIISDLRMSGEVDGMELFEWVRQNRPELEKRFLFVTGDSIGLSTGKLLRQCSAPYLQKPFSLEAYSRVIRTLLEGEAEALA